MQQISNKTKVIGKTVIRIILANNNRPLTERDIAVKLTEPNSNLSNTMQKVRKTIIPALQNLPYFKTIQQDSGIRLKKYQIDFSAVANGKYWEQSKFNSNTFNEYNSLEEYINSVMAPQNVREIWSMILSCNSCRFSKIVKGANYDFECPSCGGNRATVVPEIHNADTFYEKVHMESSKMLDQISDLFPKEIQDRLKENLPEAIASFENQELKEYEKQEKEFMNLKKAAVPDRNKIIGNIANKELKKNQRIMKHGPFQDLNIKITEDYKPILKQIFADKSQDFEKVWKEIQGKNLLEVMLDLGNVSKMLD